MEENKDKIVNAVDVVEEMRWPLSMPWQDKEVREVVRKKLKDAADALSKIKGLQGRIERSSAPGFCADLSEELTKHKDLLCLRNLQSKDHM